MPIFNFSCHSTGVFDVLAQHQVWVLPLSLYDNDFVHFCLQNVLLGSLGHNHPLVPLSFLPGQRKIFSCAGSNFSLPRERFFPRRGFYDAWLISFTFNMEQAWVCAPNRVRARAYVYNIVCCLFLLTKV